jgi:DedD protein
LASAQAGLVLPGDPVPVKPAPVAVAKPTAKDVVKPPVATLAKPAPVPVAGVFGVQVGIFAQPANVANVLTQLKGQGLPVYADAITMAGQPRTRVRVGPYGGAGGREAAQRVAAQIAELGLPAVVVSLPAAAAASDGR